MHSFHSSCSGHPRLLPGLARTLEDSEGFTRHNFDAKVSNYSLMVRLALTKNHLCPGADSWRRLALDRPPLPAAGHVLACLSPGRG